MIRSSNQELVMIGRLLLFAVILTACSRTPFIDQPPTANDASVQMAKRMDVIEDLLARGEVQEARARLQQALDDGIEHPRAFHLMGRLLARDGSRQAQVAAIPWYQRAIAASPSWPDPRIDLLQAYLEDGRLDAAHSVCEDLDRLFPEAAAGAYGRAVVAGLRGDIPAARAAYHEALERDSDYIPALRGYARLQQQQGEDQSYRRLIDRLMALVPATPGLLRERARLHEQDGRLADARRDLEYAYRLQADPTIARHLYDLARQQGDQAAADRWLARTQGHQLGTDGLDTPATNP